MVKKLLILLFIAHVCKLESMENFSLPTFSNSHYNNSIAIGVAGYITYSLIPNILNELEKTDKDGKKESFEVARNVNNFLGASLCLYSLYYLSLMIKRGL